MEEDVGPCNRCNKKAGERDGAFSFTRAIVIGAPSWNGILIQIPVDIAICYECVRELYADCKPKRRRPAKAEGKV